jgi:hypothetical protein
LRRSARTCARSSSSREMNQATQGLSQSLTFLFFAAVTFLVLRAILSFLAKIDRAALAAPVMILVGAGSAPLFMRFGLQPFFIWHMILFALVIMTWHAKSRAQDTKIIELARKGAAPAGKSDAEVIQAYNLTRRLLSFGLVSYLAAFSGAYYYLFTRS